jgi:hypothetical protein
MDQPERPAEKIDAGGDHRWTDAVVVDDERLHEVVEVTLVVRDVDRPASARRFLRDADVLVDALDLAQDRIERMLQRAIDRISLRRAQLVEIGVNALACFEFGLAMSATQIARDIFPS